ncbi:MAG: VanW family protein [Clostridia bacterium]
MEENKISKKKSKKIIWIIVSIIIIIACFSTIFALLNTTNEKTIDGVYIEGIMVSNLSREDLQKKFEDIIDELNKKEVILKYGEQETTISLQTLNITYNLDEALTKAYNLGREHNIFINNFDIIKTKLFKTNIELEINYDKEILTNKIKTIDSILPNAVIEYSYYIEDENLIITPGKEGITVDKEQLTKLIEDEIYNLNTDTQIIEIPVVNKEPDEIDLEKIYKEIYKETQDAYITTNPTTVHPHVNGVDFAITIEEAKELLREKKEEYIIPLKITVANKTINDLGEEAFPDTLGTFTTLYDATNKNRSNNISLSSEKINGTVILPGETFSYNQTVGKRTIEAGYKEAGAYAGGQVVQEIGGGICQVSSTLYNAVLYANLEIVERNNHYFETSYVDPGRDATVSWGTVDFKFKNNRTYPVKIEAISKNGVTKISIKGIKEEKEYEVVIQSKVTSIVKKTTKYREDSSLDIGVQEIEQEGHDGCTSQTYKVLKINGAVVSNELISTDYYHALEQIVIKGTKETDSTESTVKEDNSD